MNTKIEAFKQYSGDIRILEKVSDRELYSHDIGDLPPVMTGVLFQTLPDIVVQPQNACEIVKVLEFANTLKLPVIPRGTASWGLGGVTPTDGGIVIDLSPMRGIHPVDVSQQTVTVDAGARWSDIDILAKKSGLCLMTYPSSKFSTVGGWISTGGYGINSFGFGHVSRQIVSMSVVTGSGKFKKLSPADDEFINYMAAEGGFGIVVEVTLKLREVPQGSYPHLIYFPNDKTAFDFIQNFISALAVEKLKPNIIRFLDENHIGDTNEIMRVDIFKKMPAVQIEFGNQAEDEQFKHYLRRTGVTGEAPGFVANYLWNERLFGMKTKRLGPTILASEVIIPLASAARFITRAKRIGNYFGVEVCVDSHILDNGYALVMATFLCDSRKRKYYVNIPLVAMLTKTAVSLGGAPYGLGLWNAAFVHAMIGQERQRSLRTYKAQVDPNHIMNPGKTLRFGVKGVSRLLFSPTFFVPAMQLMVMAAPVMGKIATLLFGKDKKIDSLDYELSIHACAKCGNCIAECPAYVITGNEALTAKGKIALAKKLLSGQTVTNEEAAAVFLCMHCKGCEDVCQTNLELMKLWEALETRLKGKVNWPQDQISSFLSSIDASDEYWKLVERNN